MMSRSSLRYRIGLSSILIFVVLGYVLFSRGIGGQTHTPAVSRAEASEWAMEGHNPGRTRAVNTDLTLPISNQRELNVDGDRGVGSPVAIAQNTLLVEAEGRLRAIDLNSGQERWAFASYGRYISPAVVDNTVYIRAEANNEGEVFAIDLATGKQRWAFKPRRISSPATGFWGGHLTSPVIVDGIVFVGAGKELYALDAASGTVRWEYTTAEFLSSSATVGDDQIFISDATHLYAVDRQTGKLAWKTPTTFAVYFAPIVADETVFVTNGQGLLALNTADGTKRWETGVPGVALLPAAAQGSHLFVKSTTSLYALDLHTGKELWHFDHPNYISFPVVAGEQVYAITGMGNRTELAVLDTGSGERLWSQAIPNLAPAPPIIAGETVYVRTTDGRVLGLSN